ncbi:hypothetical protein B0H11DRAFT_133071 [Mycena galericulata]|nr:hypothetical protein B0H11DRAFT_133071 [Mycena galericulata]
MDATTPNSTKVSRDYQNRIEYGFEQLKNDVFNFLNVEKLAQETILKLERELNVYKIALEGRETECTRLRKLQEEMAKENAVLKEQVKGHRVITLIDGDGSIFSSDLITQGQQGGHFAARSLSDSIVQYLSSKYTAMPYQLWVYLFYNKRGLMDTFNRVGLASLNKTFEDFISGFNQAADRFTMVDVGSMKEAADAKLKAHLQDDVHLPQTFKIIFGGCHDNGYASSLHSQITAGFRDKLILLKGYEEMATAITELELPFLEIPNLFMTHKLVARTRWIAASSTLDQMVTDTPTFWDGESDEADPPGPSYSRVLQRAAPDLREKSLREQSPSTEASWESSYMLAGTLGTRRVTPGVVELQNFCLRPNCTDTYLISGVSVFRSVSITVSFRLLDHFPDKPPPCTLFYLSTCKLGSKCKYGHDYLLNDEHFQELRDNAKLGPCPMINRDVCTWGDACCYGHFCPHSTKCPFQKLGKCKFRGADMHRAARVPA